MPFPQRKHVLQQPVVVDVGCGCRQSIFSTLFSASSSSSSSLKQRIPESLASSSSSSTTSSSAATISNFSSSQSPQKKATSERKREEKKRAVKRTRRKKKGGVLAEESVAIVKESFNPYLDFYESMLLMIMEKEIYDWKDLCDLLNRYLSLNSSCQHHIILRAFSDIWNDVFLSTKEDEGK